ncbi:MAG: DUF4404 family protein [Planctomycetaceae bacterium]|nr:DUF4404 family protein [Planctomycetaceae bacterium]
MAIDQGRLRALLDDVVTEVRALHAADDATRQKLEQAATEIIQALHRVETGEEGDRESLRDRLVEFEASHPNLAAVVNRLIDMLAQMGI